MALNPSLYIQTIVKKYEINLRGSKQRINIRYNPNLVVLGKVKKSNPTVIEIGSQGISDDITLANTIAHELNHVRSWLKGGNAPESTAYTAGDALEDYIRSKQ